MPGASRIEQTPHATVVVKEALDPGAQALRAEGERLASAAHPGVVRVVSSAGDAARWELRTVHAGRPLDVGAALDARTLASVAAATATTLADLHDMGVVHGRLRSSHILIGPSGRPVICGLGADDGEQTPADDVGALGQVIVDQLAGDQTLEPIPERRWSRRRRWDGWARATLLNLAEQACADPPSRRPSARRFAAAISEAFDVAEPTTPPSHLARDATADAADDDPIEALRRSVAEPARDAKALPLRAAAGVIAIVLGAGLIVHSSTSRASMTPQPTLTRASATTTTGALPPPTTAQPTPRPAAPVEGESPRPHRCPGSACTSAGLQIDGNVVTTPSGRFLVGRTGDAVVVGDWDCDGEITPAVLRPATGEVFVFPRWAGDAEIAVGPVRTVADGVELEVVPLDGGCAALQVRTRSGDVVSVTRALVR